MVVAMPFAAAARVLQIYPQIRNMQRQRLRARSGSSLSAANPQGFDTLSLHARRAGILPSAQSDDWNWLAGDEAEEAGAQTELDLEPFREMIRGKTFMCTLCGKCCTGKGNVWVSEEDACTIAEHLKISLGDFEKRYAKSYAKYSGWRLLRNKRGSDHCVFLSEDLTCTIHEARPTQCRTYPWWPDVLASPEAWEQERVDVCEGLSHPEASELDIEAAAEALREQTKSEDQQRRSFRGRRRKSR